MQTTWILEFFSSVKAFLEMQVYNVLNAAQQNTPIPFQNSKSYLFHLLIVTLTPDGGILKFEK